MQAQLTSRKGVGPLITNKVLQHPSDVTHQISVQEQTIMQQGKQINLAPQKRALAAKRIAMAY